MKTTRRKFLGSASIVAGAALTPSLASASPRAPAPPQASASRPRTVKPPRLRPGDTIGLVDPASATWEPVDIEIVAESWAALGFKTKRGQHLLSRRGYFAGDDRERAADLVSMFADPEVQGVHCVRGGWGSARLLPLIDWKTVAAHPKVLLGFSDITALLLSIHARSGAVTFHGPVGASRWNPFNVGYLKRVLIDGEAVTFENLREIDDNLTVVENRVQTITPGIARGRLLGGNLTVLTAIVGSPFVPAWDDCILFVEDVNEEPYRIDRMFTQLALAGILGRARAVVFGTCRDCEPGDGYGSLTLTEVLNDHVKPLGVPAWQGAMIGHTPKQFTLPVGLDVEVDATAGTIRMLEPAVA